MPLLCHGDVHSKNTLHKLVCFGLLLSPFLKMLPPLFWIFSQICPTIEAKPFEVILKICHFLVFFGLHIHQIDDFVLPFAFYLNVFQYLILIKEIKENQFDKNTRWKSENVCRKKTYRSVTNTHGQYFWNQVYIQ